MSKPVELLGQIGNVNSYFSPTMKCARESLRKYKMSSTIHGLTMSLKIMIDNGKITCVIWSKEDEFPISALFKLPNIGWAGDKDIVKALNMATSKGLIANISPRVENDETRYLRTIKGDYKLILKEI